MSTVTYKPITNKDDFNIKFAEGRSYSSSFGKYKNIDLSNDNGNPLTFKLSKCRVVGVFRQKDEGTDSEKERARLYVDISDEDDIKMLKKVESQIINRSIKNKDGWFPNLELDDGQKPEDAVRDNFKPYLRYNEEYDNYNAYIDVSYFVYKYDAAKFKDFTNKDSKLHDNTKYSYLSEKLIRGSVIDLALNFRSININEDSGE